MLPLVSIMKFLRFQLHKISITLRLINMLAKIVLPIFDANIAKKNGYSGVYGQKMINIEMDMLKWAFIVNGKKNGLSFDKFSGVTGL